MSTVLNTYKTILQYIKMYRRKYDNIVNYMQDNMITMSNIYKTRQHAKIVKYIQDNMTPLSMYNREYENNV